MVLYKTARNGTTVLSAKPVTLGLVGNPASTHKPFGLSDTTGLALQSVHHQNWTWLRGALAVE